MGKGLFCDTWIIFWKIHRWVMCLSHVCWPYCACFWMIFSSCLHGCCKYRHDRPSAVGHHGAPMGAASSHEHRRAECLAQPLCLNATLVLAWSSILILIQKQSLSQPVRYRLTWKSGPGFPKLPDKLEPVGFLGSPGQDVLISQFRSNFFLSV